MELEETYFDSMERLEPMSLQTARKAGQVGEETLATLIDGVFRLCSVSSDAIGTMQSSAKVSSAGPSNYFVQISAAMKIFPYYMGPLLCNG